MKKNYNAPQLKVYGSVENMTQSAPTLNRIDVPFGTPISGEDINDVTS
ncbi:MAG: lasso peptide [Acaryochloridaceae cyanobacterium CSU_5_19]|nr:lasso peptide [Acaryochloridaceae cyanobacterium CSU_5_19]